MTLYAFMMGLQTTKRTGWVRKEIRDPESIADHMYRMGIMALMASEQPDVDSTKYVHSPLACKSPA